MTLNEPTDSTSQLFECACRLFKEAWDMTPPCGLWDCVWEKYLMTTSAR